MPTTEQLMQSMESQFEFPETRRDDDPAKVTPKPIHSDPAGKGLSQEEINAIETIQKQKTGRTYTDAHLKDFAGMVLNHYKQWGAAKTLDELLEEYLKM